MEGGSRCLWSLWVIQVSGVVVRVHETLYFLPGKRSPSMSSLNMQLVKSDVVCRLLYVVLRSFNSRYLAFFVDCKI